MIPTNRWTNNSPMQKNLNTLFKNGTVGVESRPAETFEKYIQLWPGVTKNNFSKHFKTTKTRFTRGASSGLPPPSPIAITDVDSGTHALLFSTFPTLTEEQVLSVSGIPTRK